MAWLRKQPRDEAVAFAARAALRVLPMVLKARGIGYDGDQFFSITLAVFRASAIAWARAIYPIRGREFAAAAAKASYAASVASQVASEGFSYRGRVAPRPAPAASKAARAAASAVDASTTDSVLATADLAVDATFEADAVDAFWSAVSVDATRVEEGHTAAVIAGLPLWPQGQPDQLQSLWNEMEAALLAAKENWDVWINWYRARLEGRVREEESEIAFVRVEETLWEQGPAAVNAKIIRLAELEPPHGTVQLEALSQVVASGGAAISVAEPMPPSKPSRKTKRTLPGLDIPPQRPAALEPVWSKGKLVLPSKPTRTGGDIKALSSAIKVLRAELIELADDAESEQSNFDKRVVPYLRRIGERIPDHRPSQEELFRLAHMKEFLEAYSNTAKEQWPNHLATRFHTLVLHFDRTVRQFPKWREFVRNAQQDGLTAEQATEVPAITEAMVQALRDEDAEKFIDPTIPQALERCRSRCG